MKTLWEDMVSKASHFADFGNSVHILTHAISAARMGGNNNRLFNGPNNSFYLIIEIIIIMY